MVSQSGDTIEAVLRERGFRAKSLRRVDVSGAVIRGYQTNVSYFEKDIVLKWPLLIEIIMRGRYNDPEDYGC